MVGNLTDPVPSWHIDATDGRAGRGFETWANYARPLYDARAPGGAEHFTARATGYLLDQLIFIHSRVDPMEVVRSRRHLDNEPTQYLVINIFRSGGFTGLIDDLPITKHPNDVVLQDASRPLRAVCTRSDVLGVIVPFRVLGFDPSKHRPYFSLPAESSKGRVLASVTQDIFDRLPSITREEGPAIASGYAGMLRGIFLDRTEGEDDHRSMRHAVRSAMISFMDKHLSDPDLGADLLCKTFGLSRASLYRLFQSQGGVSHMIQQRRLYRCFNELAQRDRQTTVRSVAERYGFHNPSHFTKVFKTLFYVSPSEIGEMAEVSNAPIASAASALQRPIMHDWLYRTCGFTKRASSSEFYSAAE